jgi:hypothetical protein
MYNLLNRIWGISLEGLKGAWNSRHALPKPQISKEIQRKSTYL